MVHPSVRFDTVNGKPLVAYGVHVEIYPTKVMENEVAYTICTLDGKDVIVPGV